MSRRKQQKPRHFDAVPGEEMENTTSQVDVPNGDERSLSPQSPILTPDEIAESPLSEDTTPDDDLSGLSDEDPAEQVYVCRVCCAQFLQLSELAEHSKSCFHPEKQQVVYFDEELKPPSLKPDAELDSPRICGLSIDIASDNSMMESLTADPEEDQVITRETVNDQGPELEGASDGLYAQAPKSVVSDDQEGGDENLEDEDDYDDEEEYGDDYDEELYDDEEQPQIPNGMPTGPFPFGITPLQLQIMQSNVKLESLENTKVAVAQFVENNTLPKDSKDVSSLQNTLYSLQQQQLFQLQILQQIQQQIMTSGLNSLPPAMIHALTSGMLPPLPNIATAAQQLGQVIGKPPAPSSSSVTSSSSDQIKSEAEPKPEHPGPGENVTVPTSATSVTVSAKPLSTMSTSSPPIPSSTSLTPAVSVIAKSDDTSFTTRTTSSQGLPTIPPMSSIGAPIFSTVVPEMSQICMLQRQADGKSPNVNAGGTVLDRSQYAADDPFFKHKCRFCHKVFGSDSALQIHIRSHTGERPYKCQVCGNRFSTKGNLKVHFQRHKEKYPHLEMDSTPFPEHMDHANSAPLLSPPICSSNVSVPLLPATSIAVPPSPVLPPTTLLPPGPRLPPSSIPPPLIPMVPPMFSLQHLDKLPMGPDAMRELHHMAVSDSEVRQRSKSPGNHSLSEVSNKQSHPVSSGAARDIRPSHMPTTGKIEKSENDEPKKPERPDSHQSGSVMSERSAPLTPASTPSTSLSLSISTTPPRSIPPPFLQPITSIPTPHMGLGFPMPSSLPAPPIGMPPFGFDVPMLTHHPSILPSRAEDPMEAYMECQKSETSKLEALVKNLETKLTDPNQCAICHRILSCKSALQMHYRTHTGERPFKCKICSRAFTTKGNLKTHMGVHRAKPPLRMMHQCPVCHKQFTNSLVLQQHIRMHTGDLPKDLPIHGPDAMMPTPYNYMPFPAFPFFPPGLPPPHPGFNAEMDFRKAMLAAGDRYIKSEEGRDDDLHLSHAADDLNSEYNYPQDDSNDEDLPSDDDDEEAMEPEDAERSLAVEDRAHNMPSDIDRSASPISRDLSKISASGSDHSDQDIVNKCRKNPFPHMTSTPQPAKRQRTESPSSRPIMHFEPYGNPDLSDEYTPTYSTSLMALEDHVKTIDSMETKHFGVRPLEQMENIVKRTESDHVTPPASLSIPNGRTSTQTSPAMPVLSREDGMIRDNDSVGSIPSPAPSDSNISHASMESSKMDDCRSSQRDSPEPFGPGFGVMDLTSKAFEDATGKPHTTCDVCFKTFACRSALDIHYRSHTKERPFHCDACDRSFSTRGNLRQHMLTHKLRDLPEGFNSNSNHSHSNESTPSKSEPTQSYSTSSTPTPAATPIKSLEATPTTPTSPFVRRPNLKHVCQVCNKPFSSASALQIHMRTHTGDKPFKCNVCGKAFTTKGNLKVHMGTHMWNNGPSRRGRRMSVEGIPGLQVPPRDVEFFKAFAHRPPPELYPFPYPPFPNGFGPKLNEISVIQNRNGGMTHLPPTSAAETMMGHLAMMKAGHLLPHSEALTKTEAILKAEESMNIKPPSSKSETNNNSYPPVGSSGELDLSVRRPKSQSPPPKEQKLSAVPDHKTHRSVSASKTLSAGTPWLWKTTCHLCNQMCPSQSALELHMKAHLPRSSENTPKPLMA